MAELIDDHASLGGKAAAWQLPPSWESGPRILILATASMHRSDDAPWDSECGHAILIEGPGLGMQAGDSPAGPVLPPPHAATTNTSRSNPTGVTLSAERAFTVESDPVLDAMVDALADAIVDEMAIDHLVATGALKHP
jgi:hypothetical protein